MCFCSRTVRHLTLPNTINYLQSDKSPAPAMWPANSPELNLIDYAVWGALQQSVLR